MLVSLLGVSRVGRADVVPLPGDCANKKEGDACQDEQHQAGACGTLTYTATNNATNPPTSSQRTYFGCRAGAKPKSRLCSVSTAGAPSEGGACVLASLAIAAVAARRRRRR